MQQRLKVGKKTEGILYYLHTIYSNNVNITKCTPNDIEDIVKIRKNSEVICFIKNLGFYTWDTVKRHNLIQGEITSLDILSGLWCTGRKSLTAEGLLFYLYPSIFAYS